MGEWRDATLGDMIELKRGHDLPQQDRHRGTIPIVSSSGVSDYHSVPKVKGPGVVTGRYGTLGQVFYVTEDFWPLNTTLYVCNFKGNDPRFVSYFLRSVDFLAYSDKAAVPGLNRNHLHQALVRYPTDIMEQRAIGHILGTLDDKIELNRQTNDTLEAMARALFKSWFVDFDPVRAKADGRDSGLPKHVADLFPDRFEESELVEIPAGWSVGTIDEAASLIIDYRGKTPKKLGREWSLSGIPAVSAKNIKKGRLVEKQSMNFVDQDLYDVWMKDRLAVDDILMTSEAPLGELLYLAGETEFCLSQRVFALRANRRKCTPSFLFFWLASDDAQERLQSRATGTTVLGIRQSELRRIEVLLPPLPVQEAAHSFFEPSLKTIAGNEKRNETLATLRDTLLPKLISGELGIRAAEQFVTALPSAPGGELA